MNSYQKSILLLALFLFSSNLLKADSGSCVLYYAKFYLTDGTIFNGCFEAAGDGYKTYLGNDEKNKFCSDEGVMEAFKIRQKNSSYYASIKVSVYKEFFAFKPESIYARKEDVFNQTYAIVEKEDVIHLDSTEIREIIFWKVERCKYDWPTSEIVVGSARMIDTLQNEKYWNEIYIDLDGLNNSDTLAFSKNGTIWGYHLINYSSKNNTKELKRLATLRFRFLVDRSFEKRFRQRHGIPEDEPVPDTLQVNYNEELESKIQLTKEWFWKKGIFVIRVNGTC